MITLVMAYYENGGMLDEHFKAWKEYKNKSNYKIILVDDGSPKDPAEGHIKDVGIPVELYRIKKDIPWNQNGARNLGMTHADGTCLITDMDHLLDSKNAENIIKYQWYKNKAYRPLRYKEGYGPYKRHPNTYVIHTDLYWKMGGYDESFCGWYGSDSTFRNQLGDKIIDMDLFTMRLYGREIIPDASTTNYGRKKSKYQVGNNPELRRRKKENPPPIKPLNFDWERVL